MACHTIINGIEYVLPHEQPRSAEERLRMAIDGMEVILSIQVSDSGATADLHILPNSISTYAVYEIG